MGNILIGIGIALAAIYFIFPNSTDTVRYNSSASDRNWAAAHTKATASNGELGEFWVAGGKTTQINLYEHLGICLKFNGSDQHKVQQWRQRANSAWVPGRKLTRNEVKAGIMDAAKIWFPRGTEAERYLC